MSPATASPTTRAAGLFHALSDETRLEIIEMLSHGERCVCDLMSSLDAAQSRLSFHLKTLKDAGFVTDRRDGRWVYYTLNRAAMDELVGFVNGVRPGKHAGSCTKACC